MGYFMQMNNSNEFENWCILLGAGCFCWKRKNRTLICVFLISWLKKGKCKIRMFKADIRAPFGFFLTSNVCINRFLSTCACSSISSALFFTSDPLQLSTYQELAAVSCIGRKCASWHHLELS